MSIDKVRSSEKAVILTTDNFDDMIKGKLAFIKFYAPYCPHCKEMAGAWNELATYYEDLPNTDNILIGSIDCTDSPKGKELCARFKIMGLPTLLYGDASLGALLIFILSSTYIQPHHERKFLSSLYLLILMKKGGYTLKSMGETKHSRI